MEKIKSIYRPLSDGTDNFKCNLCKGTVPSVEIVKYTYCPHCGRLLDRKWERQQETIENNTNRYLQTCLKHGIKLVSIGVRTPLIAKSISFPFGVSGSVFAEGYDEKGRPIIWAVCDELNYRGCGNTFQHTYPEFSLKEGVYEYSGEEGDGKWHVIKENS